MPGKPSPMTCGRRVLRNAAVAFALVCAVVASASAGAPDAAAALLARMGKAPPVATAFIQVSYRGVLSRPLVVSGTMRWLGGDRLERDIDKPFIETAKIGGGELSVQRGGGEVHRIALARAPQAAAMLAGFRALLGGDVAELQKNFSLASEGGGARWLVTLTPRTPALKRQLQSIAIDGRGEEPRCLTVTDANGDSSITLVGAMARQGLESVAPLESALAARCRNDP